MAAPAPGGLCRSPICFRQQRNLLAEESLLVLRRYHLVGDQVIYEVAAGSPWITHIFCLDRGGTMSQHPGPGATGMAAQIDGDVDFPLPQKLGHLAVALLARVMEAVEGFHKPLPHGAAVIGTERNRGDFERGTVMALEHFRRQRGRHMLMEVG